MDDEAISCSDDRKQYVKTEVQILYCYFFGIMKTLWFFLQDLQRELLLVS